MEIVRATVIGTTYEIDFFVFSSRIVLLRLISEVALASANKKLVLSG